MNLYLDNNYLDMGAIISAPYPFIVVISARGGGKTYGALKYVIEKDLRFLYMRRSKTILEIVTDQRYQPFKKLNDNEQWQITPDPSGKGLPVFRDRLAEGEPVVGYAAALSTFANVRGFDASDVDIVIWDEFIPEPTERCLFNGFTAFANALETIGRNRELEGLAPLKVLLLSNSDLIYGDVVEGFHIGDELLDMQEHGIEVLEHSKDMLLIMPKLEAYAAAKADTALYRLTEGSSFAEVALQNTFPVEDRSMIKRRPLAEYKPVCAISGICVYRHKTGRSYYVTDHVSGDPVVYGSSEADLRRYLREQKAITAAWLRKRVYFSGINVQTRFRRLYNM